MNMRCLVFRYFNYYILYESLLFGNLVKYVLKYSIFGI